MRTFIFLILFLSYINYSAHSQEQLTFTFRVVKNSFETTCQLVCDKEIHMWTEMSKLQPIRPDANYVEPQNYQKEKLFKNFKSGEIYSLYRILEKMFYVKDPLHIQDWMLSDTVAVITGQRCKGAQTSFRGRKYVAFYAPDIPIASGPWKFQGLPGMILKVETNQDNEKYVFECIRIEKTSKNISKEMDDFLSSVPKKNSFKDWESFKKDFESYANLYIKKTKSSLQTNGNTGYVATIRVTNYPEIFHPDIQTKGVSFDY